MSKKRTFKHLNQYDRTKIHAYINLGYSITKIAELIGVNKSTISREISKRSIIILGRPGECTKKNKTGFVISAQKEV